MNRKTKRQMKKDLNLINDIYNIINKYFPKLLNMFNNLTDIRHQSYVIDNINILLVQLNCVTSGATFSLSLYAL